MATQQDKTRRIQLQNYGTFLCRHQKEIREFDVEITPLKDGITIKLATDGPMAQVDLEEDEAVCLKAELETAISDARELNQTTND